MSYLRAEDVLPKEVIEIIQQYVSGKNIYSLQGETGLGQQDRYEASS